MTAEDAKNLKPAAELQGNMRKAMPAACKPNPSRLTVDVAPVRLTTGEPCPECGGFLVPESGCWVCLACGYSPCG